MSLIDKRLNNDVHEDPVTLHSIIPASNYPLYKMSGSLKKLMKNYQTESIQCCVWDKQTFLELRITRLWFTLLKRLCNEFKFDFCMPMFLY